MNENKKIADIAQSIITAAELLQMSAATRRLRIGFIPLADAAALIVAVDKGFAAAEGLDVELVREVSWSNVRDKLNIGLFDAAHLLAPVAIASSLGLGHVQGADRGAVRSRPQRQRHHGLARAVCGAWPSAADGDIADPMVSARALARVVAAAQGARAQEPLTFGMTFPVLHPQLSAALLDGGRRRRSRRGRAARRAAAALHGGEPRQRPRRCLLRRRALEFGRGRPRHRPHPAFRLARSCRARPRRCWRCAADWARRTPTSCMRLVRAHRPGGRLRRGRQPTATRSPRSWRRPTASASPRRLSAARSTAACKVAPDGTVRPSDRYLLVGRKGAARPDPGAGGVALCADGALGPGADVGRDCSPPRRRSSGPIFTMRRPGRRR